MSAFANVTNRVRGSLAGNGRLLYLSVRLLAGRWFWAAPLIVLVWPAVQLLRVFMGWQEQSFEPADAQGTLIGFPLTVLAIGLGVRVIAGEIDRRTLEIAYTVPGGAQRIWLSKLAAAGLLLVLAEATLAAAALIFFQNGYPPGALYGALQGAVFYLVLSMAMSALFKSEATGAMATATLLVLNGVFTGFGQFQLRTSPFWNPAALPESDPASVLAWTLQNRIGFVLIIAAVAALAFGRAEQRERMLAS